MVHKNLFTLQRQKELILINRVLAILVVVFTFSTGFLLASKENLFSSKSLPTPTQQDVVDRTSVGLSIESVKKTPLLTILKNARYTRVFDSSEISQDYLFRLMYAAQGKITTWGERTVPSYKSQFPIRLELLIRDVTGITPGLYWFNPLTQTIEPEGKVVNDIFPDTLPGLHQAPLLIIATTSTLQGTPMIAWQESGGIAQNLLLAASESKLSTLLIPISALTQLEISNFAFSNQEILWIMPVSHLVENNLDSYGDK
jgi:hypothetical protein